MDLKRTHISFKSQLRIVIIVCSILTAIEILNVLSGRSFNAIGIIPRDFESGLRGILLAPFIHANIGHFLANIIPFSIFSFLVLQHGLVRYMLVTGVCIILSGLLVWGMGRSAIHIGSSGLIYGYFGFLLLAGLFSRELKLIAISAFVGISYGGLIFGILPVMPFVSWESHLFGLLSGFLCAYLWAYEKKSDEISLR